MPDEKELEKRVHQIMAEDVPQIRVKLAELSGKQDRSFEKLEDIERAISKHFDATMDTNKLVQTHAVRLASLETKEEVKTKKRDLWLNWKMGIFGSVVTALLVYAMKLLGWAA
jgi:chromosome segregation ATPase